MANPRRSRNFPGVDPVSRIPIPRPNPLYGVPVVADDNSGITPLVLPEISVTATRLPFGEARAYLPWLVGLGIAAVAAAAFMRR